MLIKYGTPSETEEIEVSLALKGKAQYLAVYGREGAMETPEIIKANKGVCKITLKGEEGEICCSVETKISKTEV